MDGGHPPSAVGGRGAGVHWRGLPQGVGTLPAQGDCGVEGARAAPDAGGWPAGPAPCGACAGPSGARRHDHPDGTESDVGHRRHPGGDPAGGPGHGVRGH